MSKVVSLKKVKVPSVLYKAPTGELEYNGHHFQVSCLDKVKTKGGVHSAFICPSGWCWMVADYAAQEMRIMANFSGEPNFINPILAGKDIHTYIAEQMFGYSNPDHRKKVKILNFALSYGANEYTIAQKLGIPVDEAKSLIDHYFKTLSKFAKWRQDQCKIGRRQGIIYTLFGRPRLVYKYYNSSERQRQAFGDRTCMNSPVQGNLAESSMVLTDRGLYSLKELSKLVPCDSLHEVPNLRVWTGYSFQPFRMWDHDVQQIINVHLKSGLLIKSGQDHLFKVVTDEGIIDKHVHDLSIGDKLLTRGASTMFPSDISDDSCLVYGHYLGDVAYDNSTTEQNSNRDSLGYPSALVSAFNIPHGVSETSKRLSPIVFKLPSDKQSLVIRGLYDSVGIKSYPLEHGQYAFLIVSEGLLKDVQLVLSSNGLQSSVRKCFDGGYFLVIKNSFKFADWIKIPQRNATLSSLRIQDKTITPKFLIDELLSYESLSLKGFSDYPTEEFNRNQTLIHKMKVGEPVSLSTFYNVCRFYGFTPSIPEFTYEVVSSIDKTTNSTQTYCVSIKDANHSYWADGVIHHNCIPLDSYVELKDSAIPLKSILGKKVETANGNAVYTHRGEGDIVQCIGDTGDFIFCDTNHKLVTGSLVDPIITSIRDSFSIQGESQPCLLSRLHSKHLPSKNILHTTVSEAISTIKAFILRGDEIKFNEVLNDCFWKLWWKSEWFALEYKYASNIRSIATIFGFNVVYSLKRNSYKVTFRRHKSTKIVHFKYVDSTTTLRPVGCATMLDGYEIYQSQGFLNKNSGGDLMRLDLIKIMKLFDTDPEWANNVMFQMQIHDECDFVVKQEYLATAVKKLEELMFFQAPGMAVPIVAEPAVGKDWGSTIDLKDGFTIDNEGKLHSDKFDPK